MSREQVEYADTGIMVDEFRVWDRVRDSKGNTGTIIPDPPGDPGSDSRGIHFNVQWDRPVDKVGDVELYFTWSVPRELTLIEEVGNDQTEPLLARLYREGYWQSGTTEEQVDCILAEIEAAGCVVVKNDRLERMSEALCFTVAVMEREGYDGKWADALLCLQPGDVECQGVQS